jgi:hypothetical protein
VTPKPAFPMAAEQSDILRYKQICALALGPRRRRSSRREWNLSWRVGRVPERGEDDLAYAGGLVPDEFPVLSWTESVSAEIFLDR